MELNYDYFKTPDCKISKSKVVTNSRYKNFTQIYYTVGDSEQFWVENTLKNPLHLNKTENIKELNIDDNLFENIDTFDKKIPFYQNVSEAQVEDTFNYIFNKFKKGIFVRIKDGKLHSFIPFSKAFYINEWYNQIQIDPKYGDSFPQSLINFFKHHHDVSNKINHTNYKFNLNTINLDTSCWYANNCILRYESPINEGETNYAQLKSMFLELCKSRSIPDIEFFLNKRDFPLLTKNGTEPYNQIYGDNVPLKSFKFNKYMPILSMCSSKKYADIAIPTHEDWARIKSKEGIFFPLKCRNYNYKFNYLWESKKNLAVFRGSNTGCGFDTFTNTRLKLSKIAYDYPQFLDAGISTFNLRIRKVKNSPYLQIPNVENLKTVNKLSPEEQSNYKFLIHVDGHVSAFRLSLELSMGCCILIIKSSEDWKMWFSDMIEPYVHYVPVKSDLSDLITQIKWCLENDKKCKIIAQNALEFYNKYLTKKGVLDYLQKTLVDLRYQMYPNSLERINIIDPLLFMSDKEYYTITSNQPSSYKITGLFPRNVGRNYGVLKGFEQFLHYSLNPSNQVSLLGVEVQPIFKSKTTLVTLYQIGTYFLLFKNTTNAMKRIEFIHEAFIGLKVINNLLKICPNYAFTFKYRDEPYLTMLNNESPMEVSVMREYIKGPTLQEFMKNCTFKSYLEVILSLTCALLIGQENCGFVHHDLKPWNIIIKILNEPITVDYFIKNNLDTEYNDLNYKIKTRCLPIIIDYGKSHVIFNNIHFGLIDDPFSFDRHTDLLTLLLWSMNEFIPRLQKENLEDINDLNFLLNFISVRKLNGVSDFKNFINKTKKYPNICMERLNIKKNTNICLDFLTYCVPLIRKYKISFGKANAIESVEWISNARQICDAGFALSLEEKVNSYLNVARRIYKNPLPQASNRFTTFMIAQQMFQAISIPKMEFLEFTTEFAQQKQSDTLDKNTIQKVLEEFNRMEKFLITFYGSQLNKKKRENFNLNETLLKSYDEVINFNFKLSRSFLLSLSDKNFYNKVVSKIEQLPEFIPIHHHRLLINNVLKNNGPFKLSQEDKNFYMDTFKLIFDEKYTSKVIEIDTIRFYIKEVIKK